MAKFYGAVGYSKTVEVKKGVWKQQVDKKTCYGDITRNTRRNETVNGQTNDNLRLDNQISIVADDYATQNYSSLLYVVIGGAKWKITSVELQYPRLILTIGGVYNAEE